MPVEDATDERRNEGDLGLGAGDGLGEAEEKGQIAVYALALEYFGGLDAFPSGGDFDQHAVLGDAGFFVEGDDLARFGEGAGGVEGKTRVHFGGDATGDDFEDFEAEDDEQAINDLIEAGGGTGVGDGFIEQGGILGHGGGLEDERGVGGRIARGEGLHALEVAGIGDDDGELFELVELGGH